VGEARRLLPGVPVQALTATATKRVRDDVKRILRLRDPVEVTGSVDRPNISLEVVDGGMMSEEQARLDPHAAPLTRAMHDGAQAANAPRVHTCNAPRSAPRHAPCATRQERNDLYEWLCEHEGAGLVYCGRRQTCDELAGALAEAGVDAVAYHAGKDAATRSRLQRGFCGGDTRVMVATVPRTMACTMQSCM
jgi:superfamily II DNA helicase RecQ